MNNHGLKGRKQSPEHAAKRAKAVAEARNRNGTAGRKKGFIVSEEQRQKQSLTMKGRTSPNKGKETPQEVREAIAHTLKDKELMAIDSREDPHRRGLLISNKINDKKQRAKKRGIDWYLTKVEAAHLLKSPCNYCGKSFDLDGMSIDRIDSNGGYTTDNTVPCCHRCNSGKNNMTVQEFKDWVISVYNHLV